MATEKIKNSSNFSKCNYATLIWRCSQEKIFFWRTNTTAIALQIEAIAVTKPQLKWKIDRIGCLRLIKTLLLERVFMNTIGNYAPDFEIPGIDKEVYHLGSYRQKYKAIAVVFMGNISSAVDQYVERLKQIQIDFGDRDFTIMGIDSNHRSEPIAESIEMMQKYAHDNELNFPYLRDPTQDVAKSFKAKVIPTVYLLDSDAVIRYQGRIDDCSESIDKVEQHYLRDSIAAMLEGRQVACDYVEPVGEEIKWRAK